MRWYVAVILALGGVSFYLGWRLYQAHEEKRQIQEVIGLTKGGLSELKKLAGL